MHKDRSELLRTRVSWLFAIAGVLLTIHASIGAVRAFTELQTPADFFAPLGHVVAFVGLLLIVRVGTTRTADRLRLVVVPVALAILGWTGLTLVQLSDLLGVAPAQVPAWFGPYLLGSLAVGVVAFALVALVSLRVAGLASRVGGLLAVPAGLFALLLLSVFTVTPAVSGFVVGSGFVLAYSTTAYVLYSEGRTASPATTGDVPTG